MNFKNNLDVKPNNLKLTNEEIKSMSGFEDISSDEAEALADFIYSLSMVLYKSNGNHE
jgi:hypothetical protein